MGLIEQEIAELRKMSKDVLDGKMKPEQAAIQLGIFSQVAKREQMILTAVSLAAKHSRSWKKIVGKNLLGAGVAIDVLGNNCDKVVCKERGMRTVTLDECLDHSGDSKNFDVCKKCDHFDTARMVALNQ